MMKSKVLTHLAAVIACVFIVAAALTVNANAASYTQVPAMPALTGLSSSGSGTVTVTWNAAERAEGYNIYRQISAIDDPVNGWVKVGTVNGASTCSFTDNGIRDDRVYAYTVKAFNNQGESDCDAKGVTGITAAYFPSIYDVKITGKSENGFTVSGKIRASAAVTSVTTEVYTTKNDTDDLVKRGVTVQNNSFSFYVPKSEHKNESGEYKISIRAVDALGRSSGAYPASAFMTDGFPHLANPAIRTVTATGYEIGMTCEAYRGVKSATVYTYTDKSGSGAGKTTKASVSDGVLVAAVNFADHGNYSGNYYSVVTLTDVNGRSDSYTFTVNSTEAGKSQDQLTFINVRGAASALAESNGQFLLIDAGMQEDTADEVRRVLQAHGASSIDVLITHPHCDHLEGLKAVSDYVHINKIYMHAGMKSDYYMDHVIYDDVFGYMNAKGIPIVDMPALGSTFNVGNIRCEIVGPASQKPVGSDGATNNNSTWIKLYFGNRTALISGDAEAATEKETILSGRSYDVDIVQANHHGLQSSNSSEFVTATSPTYAVMSQSDAYTVSTEAIAARYRSVGATVFRTNQTGGVNFRIVNNAITERHYNSYSSVSSSIYPTKINVSGLGASGYTVKVEYNIPNGIRSASAPTWTQANGMDDIQWYTPSVSGNTVTLNVKTANHKNESGVYATHFYVTDRKGIEYKFEYKVTVPSAAAYKLAIDKAEIKNVTSSGYQVVAYFTSTAGVSRVQMPTWTEKGGQDDIVWHNATVSGNTATFNVKVSDHKNESGKYNTHVYVYDNAGKQAVKALSTTVPAKTASSTSTSTSTSTFATKNTSTATSYVYNGTNYSLVFDPTFYSSNYSDLKRAYGTDASKLLSHFVNCGITEGRQAKNTFSVIAYRDRYPDLKRAFGSNMKAYVNHFISYGYREGRNGAPTGTTAATSTKTTSTTTTKTTTTTTTTTATSYKYGGVDYKLVFDPTYYSNKYPDLKRAFGTNASKLLDHFVNCGIREGRQAHSNFNVVAYKNRYPDLRNAFGSNMKAYVTHYISCGYKEGRNAK